MITSHNEDGNMYKINLDAFSSVTIPKNLSTGFTVKPDEEPLMIIPKDKGYIEILGHRIDGFNNLEEFADYLLKLREFDRERESMEAELRKYKMNALKIQKYLDEKIASSMFLRDHIDGGERLSRDETIYRTIRDMIYVIEEED